MRTEITRALQTALVAAWNTSPPTELVLSTDKRTSEAAAPWCRATIAFADMAPATVGDTSRRGTAIVQLQIFTPEGHGIHPATDSADRLDAIAVTRIPVTGVTGWNVHLESDGATEGPTPAGPREGYEQFMARLAFRIEAYRQP